jgi:acetylglutamate kinase
MSHGAPPSAGYFDCRQAFAETLIALAEAEPMKEELGAVGRIVRSNAELLRLLTANGYLPVVACVAGDRQGRIYNVNADQMAVACAAGFGADKLFFLTDVDGVRGADGQVIPALAPAEAVSLIASGVAAGGMQAKLTAAIDGLRQGIGEVVIVPGGSPRIVERLLGGETAGSRLVGG